MLNEFEKGILNTYQSGGDLNHIAESFDTTYNEVKKTLIKFKESNRRKRAFTDEFKEVIAERDINGVSRRQISLELEINASTVKRACEQFGQAFKEKTSPVENKYTLISGDFNNMSVCPTCNSQRVNKVDDNATYCLKCGNEHIHKDGHIFRINWEYLD